MNIQLRDEALSGFIQDSAKVESREQLDTAATCLAAARAASARADWASALKLWQNYSLLNNDDPNGVLGLAEAYRGLKQPDDADDSILRYTKSGKKNTLDPVTAELAISYALNAARPPCCKF
jgi:hypothetical protein